MHKRHHYYISSRGLWVTIIFLIIPFLFLVLFSNLIKLDPLRILEDTGISLWRIFIAYILAAFVGWFLAVLFYKGGPSKIALPVFEALQSFPIFAALPFAVTYWGRGNFTVIVFLALEVIWPVFFSTVSSLKMARADWGEAVEISGIKDFNYLKRYLFPVSLPGFVTGSVIGLGDTWQALVATEIIVETKSGVGTFFNAHSQDSIATVWGIMGLLIIIFTINKILWIPLLDRSHKMTEE